MIVNDVVDLSEFSCTPSLFLCRSLAASVAGLLPLFFPFLCVDQSEMRLVDEVHE